MPVEAEDVGDLVVVDEHGGGAVRQDGLGEAPDRDHRRLDVHVRVDEPGHQVGAVGVEHPRLRPARVAGVAEHRDAPGFTATSTPSSTSRVWTLTSRPPVMTRSAGSRPMQTSDSVRVRLDSEGRPWTMRGSFSGAALGRGLCAADDRVDRERAAGAGHRDAVMAVADRVRVAHRDDRDRRQQRCRAVRPSRRSATARASARAGRKSRSNCAARLGSTVPLMASSGFSRSPSRPRSAARARRGPRAVRTLRRSRAAARQRGAPARARRRAERLLGFDLGPGLCTEASRAAPPRRYGMPADGGRDPRPARCGWPPLSREAQRFAASYVIRQRDRRSIR